MPSFSPLRRALPLIAGALFAAVTPVAAQDVTVATSVPHLGFPFFLHMQNQLNAEAESLGGVKVVNYDGQNASTKQTADVEAAIVSGVGGLVISPIDAVAMVEGQTTVFVPADEANTFRPQAVELGRRAGGFYEVRGGLAEGAPLAVSGAFTLKSALQSEELAGEH